MALATGETPVGCVLVLDDIVAGEGMNDTNRSLNVRMLHHESFRCMGAYETPLMSLCFRVTRYLIVR